MMTDNEGHDILSLTAKYHSIWSKCLFQQGNVNNNYSAYLN